MIVSVVDSQGDIVATVANGRHMRKDVRHPDGVFQWDGRLDDGRVVPDGTDLAAVRNSEDAAEGVRAFKERRRPQIQGAVRGTDLVLNPLREHSHARGESRGR